MSTRQEIMRYRGHYLCPDWCLQPDDEDVMEHHQGAWASHTCEDESVVEVRPAAEWTASGQGAGQIEIRLGGELANSDGKPWIWLTSADWFAVEGLVTAAQSQVDDWVVYDPPTDWKWAYDGAEDDQAETDR